MPDARIRSTIAMPSSGPRNLRHHVLVLEPVLLALEVRGQVEDRAAVLAGRDPAGGERPAVADPLHVVHDRHAGVAGAQEVGVQRVDDVRRVDGVDAGDHRLGGHLTAEDALAVGVGLLAAVQVEVDLLEIEQLGGSWVPAGTAGLLAVDRSALIGLPRQGRRRAGRRQGWSVSGLSSPARNCSNC